MGRFDNTKATINANIKQNGNQEITGQIMNNVLTEMVNATDAQLTELEGKSIYFQQLSVVYAPKLKELYLEGLQSGQQYKLYEYKTYQNGERMQVYIRDNNNVVVALYDGVYMRGLVQLNEYNNSGIKGYAVVELNRQDSGLFEKDVYVNNDIVANIDSSPSIKAHLISEGIAEIERNFNENLEELHREVELQGAAINGKLYSDSLRFDSTYQQIGLSFTIPSGATIRLIGDISQLTCRTNEDDTSYQNIKDGSVSYRDINYVKNGSTTGVVTINCDVEGIRQHIKDIRGASIYFQTPSELYAPRLKELYLPELPEDNYSLFNCKTYQYEGTTWMQVYIRNESTKEYYALFDAPLKRSVVTLKRNGEVLGYALADMTVDDTSVTSAPVELRYDTISNVDYSPSIKNYLLDALQVDGVNQLLEDIDELSKMVEKNEGVIKSLRGLDCHKKNADNLTELVLDDYPSANKIGDRYQFVGMVSQFNALKIGKRNNNYAAYFRVTTTDVELYDNGGSLLETSAHSLTIDKMVSVNINIKADGVAIVTINTYRNTYTHEFSKWGKNVAGDVFVTNEGSYITNAILTATSDRFSCGFWAVGASYETINNQNWPKYVMSMGYDAIMVNGYPGRSGTAAVNDFRKMLNYGIPKYVYFPSSNEPNIDTYKANLAEMKRLCEERGITLIGYFRPDNPSTNNSDRRQALLDAGIRYVDAVSALVDPAKTWAEGVNTWYDGYLGSDNVHPTSLGAQSLAMRMLSDIPEIMQYRL